MFWKPSSRHAALVMSGRRGAPVAGSTPIGTHALALGVNAEALTLAAASACAQRTYCTCPPLHAHSSPKTTVARILRAPISAIR